MLRTTGIRSLLVTFYHTPKVQTFISELGVFFDNCQNARNEKTFTLWREIVPSLRRVLPGNPQEGRENQQRLTVFAAARMPGQAGRAPHIAALIRY